MSSSHKVFIYNGAGSAEFSVPDLKELLSSEVIFGSKPDVTLTTFDFNPAGITNPTIVIPGGDTFAMKDGMHKAVSLIESHVGQRYNFIGVCAGAFAATVITELFTQNRNEYKEMSADRPPCLADEVTRGTGGFNLNLISSYKALGPFYPNSSFDNFIPRAYVPYITNVRLANGKVLPQFYVAGAGFVPETKDANNSECSVAATYSDQRYNFFYPKRYEMKDYTLVDMLARRATPERGALFLSGTHLEACVPNSKFFAAFQPINSLCYPLDFRTHAKFLANRESSHRNTEELLSETFKPR